MRSSSQYVSPPPKINDPTLPVDPVIPPRQHGSIFTLPSGFPLTTKPSPNSILLVFNHPVEALSEGEVLQLLLPLMEVLLAPEPV